MLGAQFLQNYYTMYDFEQKKIGLVESSTSTINDEIRLIKKEDVEAAKEAEESKKELVKAAEEEEAAK